MKFLLYLLNIEALTCVAFGLWIHSIGLIFAGLICFAIAPMIKKEVVEDGYRSRTAREYPHS